MKVGTGGTAVSGHPLCAHLYAHLHCICYRADGHTSQTCPDEAGHHQLGDLFRGPKFTGTSFSLHSPLKAEEKNAGHGRVPAEESTGRWLRAVS